MLGDEPAATVEEYLDNLSDEQRAPLAVVRDQLFRLIPGCVEQISYQLPVFLFRGQALVGLSAARAHCSLHLMSPGLAAELDGSLLTGKLSGSTIRFTREMPLDEQTVRLVVERRIAERDRR